MALKLSELTKKRTRSYLKRQESCSMPKLFKPCIKNGPLLWTVWKKTFLYRFTDDINQKLIKCT